MRHLTGRLLRAIATGLILAAERIDPQPAKTDGEFVIYGDGSQFTSTASAGSFTWHRTG